MAEQYQDPGSSQIFRPAKAVRGVQSPKNIRGQTWSQAVQERREFRGLADQASLAHQARCNVNQPETGYLKFGGDWRGVFVRGRDAMYLGLHLSNTITRVFGSAQPHQLDELSDRLELEALRRLRDLLIGVDEQVERMDVQRVKPWQEVKKNG